MLSSAVSLIRDRHCRQASSQFLNLLQDFWKGMSVILIGLDILCSYAYPTVFSTSDRYLAAKLILLVVFIFRHTVHVGLMNAVDLVIADPFLAQDLFKDRQSPFIVLQPLWWKLSLQLP
jgi:hypothetical protein